MNFKVSQVKLTKLSSKKRDARNLLVRLKSKSIFTHDFVKFYFKG